MIADAVAQETQQFRRPHVMDSFKEGRICGTCNSGWMSRLETDAKAVLPQFVNGKRQLVQAIL
jgi:hypothetical protein